MGRSYCLEFTAVVGCDGELAEAQAAVARGNLRVSKNAAAGVGETGFDGGGEDGVEEDSSAETDAMEAGARGDAEGCGGEGVG